MPALRLLPTCPTCPTPGLQVLSEAPRQKFSLKVGTIFEDSPIGLDKWLPAMWMLVNCKNGVTSYEIHRALGVTQKDRMVHASPLRLAMQDQSDGGMLCGEVEVDETFIGGKV